MFGRGSCGPRSFTDHREEITMRQIQKIKQARPKPTQEPDLRTPSGRRLPY